MVVEGEEVRAFAEIPAEGARSTRVWAEKADGTPVLEASASVGPDAGPTLLAAGYLGLMGAVDERVRMDPDQHTGALYPFSLNQEMAAITENSP